MIIGIWIQAQRSSFSSFSSHIRAQNQAWPWQLSRKIMPFSSEVTAFVTSTTEKSYKAGIKVTSLWLSSYKCCNLWSCKAHELPINRLFNFRCKMYTKVIFWFKGRTKTISNSKECIEIQKNQLGKQNTMLLKEEKISRSK